MTTRIFQAPFAQTCMGFKPSAEYALVWEEENHGSGPDDIWLRFQRIDSFLMPPEGYKGRSLSVGDVIAIGPDYFTPEFVGWRYLGRENENGDLELLPFESYPLDDLTEDDLPKIRFPKGVK